MEAETVQLKAGVLNQLLETEVNQLKMRLLKAILEENQKYSENRNWLEQRKVKLWNLTKKRQVEVVIAPNWLAIVEDQAAGISVGDWLMCEPGLCLAIVATGVTDEGVTMFPFVWRQGWW